MNKRKLLFEKIDLYPVISSEFCDGRPPLDVLKRIADGGARIVQLREKHLSSLEIYKLACEYRKICSAYNMLLIMNDHLDIALATDADGVHLGQDDLPLEAALRIAPDLIIGCSTHSPDEAFKAQSEGASYINIGPVFATQTKSLSMAALGIDMIARIAPALKIPFTVMGGIKKEHIPLLLSAGVSRIAMVTEITRAPDISVKVRELRALWPDR